MPKSRDHVQVTFDTLDGQPILTDAFGPVSSSADRFAWLAYQHAAGVVVHLTPRAESPNGLAWPGVTPPRHPYKRRRRP